MYTQVRKQSKRRKRAARRKLTADQLQARAEARASKRRAAKMKTAEDLAAVLGAGRNQTYDLLNAGRVRGAFRVNQRWFIPDAVIQQLERGESDVIATA